MIILRMIVKADKLLSELAAVAQKQLHDFTPQGISNVARSRGETEETGMSQPAGYDTARYPGIRWNEQCTDEHMHRRVGTPGKIHNMCLYVQGASVMYMVMGVGSVERSHGCTSSSRHDWFPPKEAGAKLCGLPQKNKRYNIKHLQQITTAKNRHVTNCCLDRTLCGLPRKKENVAT